MSRNLFKSALVPEVSFIKANTAPAVLDLEPTFFNVSSVFRITELKDFIHSHLDLFLSSGESVGKCILSWVC